MIWLILITLLLFSEAMAQQFLNEKSKNVILNIALSILILIVSGFITRIILTRLSAWLASWTATGGPFAILTSVASVLLIPIVFILLAATLFILIKKICKR